jgi:hypothetical protein
LLREQCVEREVSRETPDTNRDQAETFGDLFNVPQSYTDADEAPEILALMQALRRAPRGEKERARKRLVAKRHERLRGHVSGAFAGTTAGGATAGYVPPSPSEDRE